MEVYRHAEHSLIALTGKMPVPASVVIQRMKQSKLTEHVAIVVCRMTMSHGRRNVGTRGDTVVAIARDGKVITVMLRYGHQSFDPVVLGVDYIAEWNMS